MLQDNEKKGSRQAMKEDIIDFEINDEENTVSREVIRVYLEDEFFNDLKSEYVKDLVSDLNAIYEKTHKSFNVIIKNIKKENHRA